MRNSKRMIMFFLLAILAASVLYEYGILGVLERANAIGEQEDMRMKTLGKFAALIAQIPVMEKGLPELEQVRKGEAVKMIPGETLAVASANLQNSIKAAIMARNGVINSDRMERPEKTGPFQIVSTTVDTVFPDIRALSETLAAIETQTPYLVVRELDVRVRNYSDPRDLIVRMKVSALAGS
ncbi:MAG: hypothetical protein HPY65_06640 [Syntrophaceae bacterium]|nr:hypothetical protein [Syntrophaceae bacterium]